MHGGALGRARAIGIDDDQGRAALSRDLGVTWQEAVGVRQGRCGAVAGRGETLALTCDGRVFQLDTADEHARWRALPSLGARVTPGQVAVTRAGVFATMTDPDAYALETVHRFDKATRRWREVAVGRLLLDNVRHVKTYWIMTSLEVAQICLTTGADDIDGTVVEEKITHMAGGKTPEGLSEEFLRDLIREAGKEPVRRDTLYRRVPSRFDAAETA